MSIPSELGCATLAGQICRPGDVSNLVIKFCRHLRYGFKKNKAMVVEILPLLIEAISSSNILTRSLSPLTRHKMNYRKSLLVALKETSDEVLRGAIKTRFTSFNEAYPRGKPII